MRRRPGTCSAVAERLPAYVAGESLLDDVDLRHLGTCLRCQADVARYRRLLRVLHTMRDDQGGALAGLLGQLDETSRRLPWALVGLAVLAGAGGAAGVLALSGRHPAR